MHTALKERPVHGTTATVCTIEQQNNTLEISAISNYSKLHNFEFTTNALMRVWKAFKIGPEKLLSLESIVKHLQGDTKLKEEVEAFPTNARKFGSKKVAEVICEKTYECPDLSCSEESLNILSSSCTSMCMDIARYLVPLMKVCMNSSRWIGFIL
jgi:hypothetical protein